MTEPEIKTEDSILLTCRKMIGNNITTDQDIFDIDLIVHINSRFSFMHQLGIGDKNEVFEISDKYDTWDEFTNDKKTLNAVKSYMYYSVKLSFDPPTNPTLLEHMKKEKDEAEWRLHIVDDDTY